MRVLIGCEFSGVVRDAFLAAGHDAISCDLLPSESPGPHLMGNVLRAAYDYSWDLAIFHPPCTYLCNSGVKHLYKGGRLENGPDPARWENMRNGAEFFRSLCDAPIPRIAIENPVMHKYAAEIIGGQFSQSVQPWMFGHGECKRTCLWLKGLPKLRPTHVVPGREQRVHMASPGPNRWKERSITYSGLAKGMASQWGNQQILAQHDGLLAGIERAA